MLIIFTIGVICIYSKGGNASTMDDWLKLMGILSVMRIATVLIDIRNKLNTRQNEVGRGE